MSFIYLFLPLVCLVYFLVKAEFRNTVLLIASIIFYGWGEPNYLAVMIMTIVLNYTGALLLDRYRAWKLPIVIVTIVLDLSFLCYFKYFNFVAENINGLFSLDIKFIEVIMPIGISFYTFQAMSYLLDVYRGDSPVQKDLYKLSLYITLFPQLVAGPIVKYHDVSDQIEYREVTFEKVSYGVKRFIIGLSKKMLIANTLGSVADKIFSQPVEQFDALTAWTGAFAYSLQLFYDFSGYSDMAIGLGMIFGFRFLENFNYPYISRSITEFWRRWHITLGKWFRDYVYIPLGGNRKGFVIMVRNLLTVWLLTGFWHGADWNFLLWGLLLFALISVEKMGLGRILNRFPAAGHLYMALVIPLNWLVFAISQPPQILIYLQRLFPFFTAPGTYTWFEGDYLKYGRIYGLSLLAGLIFMTDLPRRIYSRHRRSFLTAVILIVLFWLCVYCIKMGMDDPFLYFRF